MRRQTPFGGALSVGSGRALRLDPLALPLNFTAADARADERVRHVELSRERVVLRRAVRGIRMAVNVPVAAFLGVAFGMKILATYLAARGLKVPVAEARCAAITLSASGGELALVVAKGGADIGATTGFVLPFVGALTVVTTVVAPYLIRFAWRPMSDAGSLPSPHS